MGDITGLLARARDGDAAALEDLFQTLYPELRRIAHSRLRRGTPDPDLGTTALVNECFIKLRESKRLDAKDHSHFLAYTAAAMRSIVIDIARTRATQRRGGDAAHQTLDDAEPGDVSADVTAAAQILRVHEALQEIGQLDARLVQLVEMRYFAGMSDAEIAQCMAVTDRTVRRDWQKARILLAAALA